MKFDHFQNWLFPFRIRYYAKSLLFKAWFVILNNFENNWSYYYLKIKIYLHKKIAFISNLLNMKAKTLNTDEATLIISTIIFFLFLFLDSHLLSRQRSIVGESLHYRRSASTRRHWETIAGEAFNAYEHG